MRIKIYADGANLEEIKSLSKKKEIIGFTTNPSLMAKSGVKDYEAFAKEVIEILEDKPLSLEVFSDDITEMEKQAKIISSWSNSVYVKIPVTNSKGEFTSDIIKRLSNDGVKLNITAIFTLPQVDSTIENLSNEVPSIISIFAGRIANTGIDPMEIMIDSVNKAAKKSTLIEILWASAREPLNIIQAEKAGCQIITLPKEFIDSIALFGKDLDQYSLETVRTFYEDAVKSGYKIT